jgi:hypothetical protein
MARLPEPNGDSGVWGSVLNDFLTVSHNADGTLKPVAVADGGVTNVKVAANAAIDQSKINGLTASLAAKADASTTAAAINAKADAGHTHTIAQVNGLQAALDSKQNTGSGSPSTLDGLTDVDTTDAVDGNALVYSGGIWSPANVGDGGTGTIPDDNSVSSVKLTTAAVTTVKIADLNVTGAKIANGTIAETKLDAATQAKLATTGTVADGSITDAKVSASAAIAQSKISGLTTSLSGKANSTHTHAAADITSGVIATARLGSGTPGTGNYLRGDGTWTAVPTGGAVTSDSITDATTVGKDVLTAASATAARTAIGAGTGNGNVTGTGVAAITKISQSAYNALSTKVSTTLYVIVG